MRYRVSFTIEINEKQWKEARGWPLNVENVSWWLKVLLHWGMMGWVVKIHEIREEEA